MRLVDTIDVYSTDISNYECKAQDHERKIEAKRL